MLVTLVNFIVAIAKKIVQLLPLLLVLLGLMLTRDLFNVSLCRLAWLKVFIALVYPLVGQLLLALSSVTLGLSLREETSCCLKHFVT